MRLQIHVYACPASIQVRRRVMRVLDGLGRDWHGRGPDDTDLDLTATYTHPDAQAGTVIGLAEQLVEITPKISFIGWEDPGEDGFGAIRAYTGKLGPFEGICDSDGMVLNWRKPVLIAIGQALTDRRRGRRLPVSEADVDAIREAADMLYGEPWRRDWLRVTGRLEARMRRS